MATPMKHIPPESLTTLEGRLSYTTSFLDITAADAEALAASKPFLAPLLPAILDAIYTKLLTYDITAKAFTPRNTDYTGQAPTTLQSLTLNNPQILLRKDFLRNYIVKLLSTTDLSSTSALFTYMDKVAQMHTGLPGFKHRVSRPELRVELAHMGLLLSFVEDIVVEGVMGISDCEMDKGLKARVIRAWNKMLWMQNDLCVRWYVEGQGIGVNERPSVDG